MAKKGGLGGLGALFGEEYTAPAAPQEARSTLPISKVEPREDQPRTRFDEAALDELTESIRQYGLIQPITVRQIDSGYYQIIAGERRWRAARAAGLSEVPVRIIEADDRRAMELALVENLQREDLNPIEEARGYRTLMEEYGLTQEEASTAVGKSRPAVANALRLLSLSAPVLELVERGELPSGSARALLPLKDPAAQLEAAKTVMEKKLSTRQTEALAAKLAGPKRKKAEDDELPSPIKEIMQDFTHMVEKELEDQLGRKIRIVDKHGKGHLELEYYSAEDREALLDNLKLFCTLRKKKK